jgi:hypothetical protein
MTNREAMRWVSADGVPAPSSPRAANPSVKTTRREFDPHEFVKTSDTIYSLSNEGRGSAGPLVTALTVAICEAAEPRGRGNPAAASGENRWPPTGRFPWPPSDEAAKLRLTRFADFAQLDSRPLHGG